MSDSDDDFFDAQEDVVVAAEPAPAPSSPMASAQARSPYLEAERRASEVIIADTSATEAAEDAEE